MPKKINNNKQMPFINNQKQWGFCFVKLNWFLI